MDGEPEEQARSGLTVRRALQASALIVALVVLVAALVAVGWILIRLLFGLGGAAVS